MSKVPERFEMKAIALPSGDQVGPQSDAGSSVSCRIVAAVGPHDEHVRLPVATAGRRRSANRPATRRVEIVALDQERPIVRSVDAHHVDLPGLPFAALDGVHDHAAIR
jgi:hypothetical protein